MFWVEMRGSELLALAATHNGAGKDQLAPILSFARWSAVDDVVVAEASDRYVVLRSQVAANVVEPDIVLVPAREMWRFLKSQISTAADRNTLFRLVVYGDGGDHGRAELLKLGVLVGVLLWNPELVESFPNLDSLWPDVQAIDPVDSAAYSPALLESLIRFGKDSRLKPNLRFNFYGENRAARVELKQSENKDVLLDALIMPVRIPD